MSLPFLQIHNGWTLSYLGIGKGTGQFCLFSVPKAGKAHGSNAMILQAQNLFLALWMTDTGTNSQSTETVEEAYGILTLF